MPGILKVGMTTRSPEIRLNEANNSGTWTPPTPYKIEFAKMCFNPKQKEITLHILLAQYTERINPRREFFRVSPEEVKVFFDLIDGELWVENINEENKEDGDDDNNDNNEDGDKYDNDEKKSESENNITEKPNEFKCRDMSKCFTNGQRVRHTIGINKTWVGIYDSSKNGILHNENLYQGRSPLNKFVTSHYESENISRSANAWLVCECEIDGKWVSTYNL
jgi:hypothetical protein